MKAREKYPNLDDLLGVYFNQDWDDDYDTPETVTNAFARDSSQKEIESTITELRTLLQEKRTKEEWYNLINDSFGCCYALRSEDLDPEEWLKKVQKQLEVKLESAKDKSEGLKLQI